MTILAIVPGKPKMCPQENGLCRLWRSAIYLIPYPNLFFILAHQTEVKPSNLYYKNISIIGKNSRITHY